MNSATSQHSAISVERNPQGLVCLFDMLKKYCYLFTYCVNRLCYWELGMRDGRMRHGDTMPLSEVGVADITKTFTTIEVEARELGLDAVWAYIERMKRELRPETTFIDTQQMVSELCWRIIDQLKSRLFLFVAGDRSQLYEQIELFGPKVASRFGGANFHIREAGTCLALERSTGAVFHLMCVLEVGLDSLAFALGLPCSQKNWQNILAEVEAKVDQIGPHSGVNWKQDAEFYSRAALEFKFFKDAWRNHVMHGREQSTQSRAREIFDHVKSFMIHLATRLRERT